MLRTPCRRIFMPGALRKNDRFYSTCKNVLEHLNCRSLLSLTGEKVPDFLQGLITNDINLLSDGLGCIYAMFLNTKGRVLCDSIIYRTSEHNYLVECDSTIRQQLLKHINTYRLKLNVNIVDLAEKYKIYALYGTDVVYKMTNEASKEYSNEVMNFVAEEPCKVHKDLLIYRDPRVACLGARIITRRPVRVEDQVNDLIPVIENPLLDLHYKEFRYYLGVSEGVKDLPPGTCFPLESNCDYLNGVSFDKGCYIGQELTARTYHTGVTRKRIMPIYLEKGIDLPEDSLLNYENIRLGKLKCVEGKIALGLLYVQKALEVKKFKIGSSVASIYRPVWWPMEQSVKKTATV